MSFRKKTMALVALTGRFINGALSLLLFSVFDVLDFVLCFVYRAIDFVVEAESRPCYCSSPRAAVTGGGGDILVSEKGQAAKIMRLTPASTKLHLEDVSDTLYTRPSYVCHVSRTTTGELRRRVWSSPAAAASFCEKMKNGTTRSTFTVNSTIVEMLKGKVGRRRSDPIPRWSDCDCRTCNSWASSSSSEDTLFVKVDGARESTVETEDVLFIHGFISSSKFWTETVFPNLSSSAKSKYRLFAVDLLGFGRSPKPSDSLYTLRDHVEMIERSVIEPYKLKDLHIVAHSLGCILALAIAVKHPGCIKSLTLLAPPYFGKPEGDASVVTQYVLKKVAPRRVWPPLTLGVSMACWYEHISRTICFLICRQHRLWEFLFVHATRNRYGTYLLEGFWCHTHNAAWHTFHNVICGTSKKLEGYLDIVRETLKCEVTVMHGQDDELIPVECSHNVSTKIPRSRVKVIERKDHLTIVVGRQKAFARELEDIWRSSSNVD